LIYSLKIKHKLRICFVGKMPRLTFAQRNQGLGLLAGGTTQTDRRLQG